MRGFRLTVVLLWLASAARAQEPAAPPVSPGSLMGEIPLDGPSRTAIAEAISRKDYLRAEELLVDAAARNPKSQQMLLVLANVLFLDGQHLNCAIALKKAEKLGPLDERHRYLLALSYITIGKGPWAVADLEALAEAHPANANYPYWLARIAYKKMEVEAAARHAKKAIELDPQFLKAYDQLGLCYDALGNTEGAIGAFQQAIRLNRTAANPSPWPPLNLGIVLLREGRLDESEAAFRDAIAVNEQFPIAHYRLGQVLEKKGRTDGAISELKLAAHLDPTYPEPHYALGRIYRQQNQIKAAEKELAIFQDLRKADQEKGVTRSN